ncbi:MAG: 2-dehydropantoate 2-reductase [Quisquiliibacterium sp.]
MSELKICIAGLGAVGGLIAARIAGSGRPVSALARGENLRRVREHGLVLLEGPAASPQKSVAQLQVSDDPHELGAQDVLIVAVKATSLESLVSEIKPLIGPQTAIVTAMNGVPWWFFEAIGGQWRGTRLASCDPHGRLSQAMPAEQIIGCVVHLSAAMTAPGEVTHRAGNALIIGAPGGAKHARLAPLAQLLSEAGFQTQVSGHVERDVWLKLWGNMTVNPISALTGATGDQILDDELVRDYMSAAMREAAQIGDAIGLPVGMTPDERHAITRKLGALRTSMLNDVQAGRPLELDALVGAVVEIGRLTGVPTPAIDSLFGMSRLFARVKSLYP